MLLKFRLREVKRRFLAVVFNIQEGAHALQLRQQKPSSPVSPHRFLLAYVWHVSPPKGASSKQSHSSEELFGNPSWRSLIASTLAGGRKKAHSGAQAATRAQGLPWVHF
mmetsp:Transcript_14512/g.36255  ORF Transcript_14512/g.36255 Transcript_14512/m.36255 type:complete len:109 (-) Transcript_14512:377-703(-)